MRTIRYGMVSLLAMFTAAGCADCPVGKHSANLIECMWDDPNMPPTEGPFIDKLGGVSPTIPIGVQSFRIKGGRFIQGMVVEIQISSPMKLIPTTADVIDLANAIVKPSWPSGLSGGTAMLVVRSADGTKSNSQPLALIRFGLSGGSSTAVPMLNKPQWVNLGQYNGMPHFFVYEPPGVVGIPYTNDKLGTPFPVLTSPGSSFAAQTKFDNDPNTDFAIADGTTMAQLNICSANTGFAPPFGAVNFGNPWAPQSLSVLAAGPYDVSRALIAVASQGAAQLFTCFVASNGTNAVPQKCVAAGPLAANAHALWVNPFVGNVSDVLSLDVSGKLSLWRGNGQLSDQTSQTIDATARAKTFLAAAVGDVDGKTGDDIVAVDGQSVITLLNNGAGSFTTTQTLMSAMPQAKAVTVGDIDGDGKTDIVLTAANTGALWVLRNQTDTTGKVDWLIPGPMLDQTDMQLAVGVNDIATLDGMPGNKKRRLVTTDIGGKQLIVWTNNTTQ